MSEDLRYAVVRIKKAPETFLLLIRGGDSKWASSRELDEHELREELQKMGLTETRLQSLIESARQS
jgi:hypothetical protein